MTPVEKYYGQWGYIRGPTEGPFSFRHRAEFCSCLRTVDPNPLRERLYEMWCRYHRLSRPDASVSEMLHKSTENMMTWMADHFAEGTPLHNLSRSFLGANK